MQLTQLIQGRFADALRNITDQPLVFAQMIRATTDARFGDFQANCAMPLAKVTDAISSNPREIADRIIRDLQIDDLCDAPEIAGPGFINLRMKNSYLAEQIAEMFADARCLVSKVEKPLRIVIDFSGPNVAKPMHVGHIRSTVIGDSLTKTLRFLGHDCVTDNHLGDWGTQFGIIIYGFKHFGDPDTVASAPVAELAKLYRLVHRLMEYEKSLDSLPQQKQTVEALRQELAAATLALDGMDDKSLKKQRKMIAGLEKKIEVSEAAVFETQQKIDAVQADADLMTKAKSHLGINAAVLRETAKLHAGDEDNLQLWEQFLPHCKDEIERVYRRLNVSFDNTLGESFYHPLLAGVVEDLQKRQLARESDGAICVFLDAFESPMIIRKQDGAYLYATTDLATLRYRLQHFHADQILYVVDTRQSEHFEKLFAVAKAMGLNEVCLVHVNFGTVLGEDGRPMKTRSGSLIGLEGLLDDAVTRAREVVCDQDRLARISPPMDDAEQNTVAEKVGIGAIKYADLAHHRTSDYRFSLDKMVALDGNTSAYVQYQYARTQSILRKSGIEESEIAQQIVSLGIAVCEPEERQLALCLLRLEESLLSVVQDHAPSSLVDYLYETAKTYAVFNENCPVLKADSEASRRSRLAFVVLSGRVLKLGLSLLGIEVVDRM